ncbi:GntR family transcriptional regulator [Aestuariicoccus sp. MJ-SS9]|uniref:GntR family transcriptional regulator n=1 Tax=Aestuariicoccus sp. MJ-SS9 TaxID=3079855 RepID=UPI00291142F5|nr:GntR family transcriptional regulator [Aestuariicoccus sp. MJ-SS9]MDU8912549.1 GntR family transcriptional regulator [Aestuariicoccus sp. MJ-SS9]
MTPLYAQLADRLLARIASGELKIGDRLPPEAEYAAELGVSRSTLRLAFAELEKAGVLRRRKRAGTEIVATAPQRQFRMATQSIDELLSLGRDTEFAILGTRSVPTDSVQALAGLTSETGYWLEISAVRRLRDEKVPFSANRVYVPARFAGIEALIGRAETSVFQLIEEAFGIGVGRVRQSVGAVACSARDSEILGIPEGAPALCIDAKLFADDGTLIEVSVATFDPARFHVETDVKIR